MALWTIYTLGCNLAQIITELTLTLGKPLSEERGMSVFLFFCLGAHSSVGGFLYVGSLERHVANTPNLPPQRFDRVEATGGRVPERSLAAFYIMWTYPPSPGSASQLRHRSTAHTNLDSSFTFFFVG